jgi:hypothetical protein
MSRTRSLQLLLLSVVFCTGLALAASPPGISALATQTQPKLNPPTALWKAYPLRQAHSGTNQPAANNKPTSTRTSKVSTTSPTRTRTGRTNRPTVEDGNRIASRPTLDTGGFPTVLVLAGVIGGLFASTFLFARYASSARAGGYRRDRGTIITTPTFPTERTTRPSRAPSNDKRPSHAKQPLPSASTELKQLPRVERPSRTPPDRSLRLKPVGEHVAAPPTPDEREATDDLLEALRPNVELVDDPEPVSAPESQLRPQRREVAAQQFCEIRLWRGWVKCQLYVEVEGSPGAFATSPLFRLRNPMVPDDRAHEILSDLLAELARSDWSVVDNGPVWYRRRLHRSAPTP